MVTNHNKHNSAWNFLAIEGIGSPCCRRLLEASLNWGTEKLLPFVPACWPLGVTTPQHSQTRNPGPPFLSPSHLCP